MNSLEPILKRLTIPYTLKKEIAVVSVKDDEEGSGICEKIIEQICRKDTVLFLAGGKTPMKLYQRFTKKMPSIGGVGMCDERFGKPFHRVSNEAMIQKTGFFDVLHGLSIPYYSMLSDVSDVINSEELASAAGAYDRKVKQLIQTYDRSVALLGLGSDGHTAGIAPDRKDFVNPIFHKHAAWVESFSDPVEMSVDGSPEPPNGFGKRITMTCEGLSQMDTIVMLVFGENKKRALQKMFENGPVQEIPARFLTEGTVAKKTLLITDQSV